MPTLKAPLLGAVVLAVISVTSSVRASQAWGASVGGGSRIDLVPINTIDGSVGSGGVSSTGESLLAIGIDDLASDPLRYPSYVWAVRSGSVNDMFVVDPYREEIISHTLLDAPAHILGVAINPVDGVLYGTAADAIYSIEPFTGKATLVAPMATPVTDGIGFDNTGRLFGIHGAKFYEIDLSDGSATQKSTLSANFAVDLAADPTDGVMYALGPNVYDWGTINVDTGAFTSLGDGLGRAGGLAFTAVPEPSCLAMLTVAGAAAFVNRRHRNIA